MDNKSSLTQTPQKPKFSLAITTKGYQQLISNTLGDPNRCKRFIASITSAVAITPALQECDAGTILAGALLGESLNLSPSPQLGQYYLVPFKIKEKRDRNGNLISPEHSNAQFVLGYKGYIQLAIRSGFYADIDTKVIHEGEYLGRDKVSGKPIFSFYEDEEQAEALPVIGYMAYFEYLNGFKKVLYWSKTKMLRHADQFSAAFSAVNYELIQQGKVSDKDMWKYSSFWYKDFDGMAQKTLIRQLIGKWGIMSTDMRTAFESDESIKQTDGSTIQLEEAPFSSEEPNQAPATQRPSTIDTSTGEVIEQASLDDF